MKDTRVVRGYGPLDLYLANQRCKTANRQITLAGKNGRILDIGCGLYPLFLTTSNFAEKYGMDQTVSLESSGEIKSKNIVLVEGEIGEEKRLPFDDNFFDVVTMLAVFEHIEPSKLTGAHREIYRVLKPGGLYFMTTPAVWTDGLLRFLAGIGLISDVEIKDHKGSYSHSTVASILQQAGFRKDGMRFGHFELFMNLWVTAVK
jgi:ubiquinone/menaquinone biosynthesis C-methylase UbiE